MLSVKWWCWIEPGLLWYSSHFIGRSSWKASFWTLNFTQVSYEFQWNQSCAYKLTTNVCKCWQAWSLVIYHKEWNWSGESHSNQNKEQLFYICHTKVEESYNAKLWAIKLTWFSCVSLNQTSQVSSRAGRKYHEIMWQGMSGASSYVI